MSGISIITNFDVNQNIPIDSRLVATSSSERDAINYKYDGMKVYQTDTKKTYLWNGTTFSVEGAGIYGGSGSLAGNTNIDFGTIGNTAAGNKSYDLQYYSTSNSNIVYLSTIFNRHVVSVAGNEWQGIEVKQQFKYYNNGTLKSGAYISYNPYSVDSIEGGLAFATGDGVNYPLSERVRIDSNGRVGINTSRPLGEYTYLQLGGSLDPNTYVGQSQPFIIHKGNNTVLGYNWYYSAGNDQTFNATAASSKISMNTDGTVVISSRGAGVANSAFISSLYASNSEVKVLSDTSAHKWENAIPISSTLQSIPDHINNTEHRYTKLQSLNHVYGEAGVDYNNHLIYISDNANSFELNVLGGVSGWDNWAVDIKILRNGTYYDAPIGTNITITFKHINPGVVQFPPVYYPPIQYPFYLRMRAIENDPGLYFISSYNELNTFDDSVLGTIIKVEHDPNSFDPKYYGGDVMNFIKVDGAWQVVNVNRESKIVQYMKSYTDTAVTTLESYNVVNYPGTTPAFSFTSIYTYIKMNASEYKFVPISPTNYILQNAPYGFGPSSYIFTTTNIGTYETPTLTVYRNPDGKVTISYGGIYIGNINYAYVRYSSGTLGSNSYTADNITGEYLTWKIGVMASGWRPLNDTFCRITGYINNPAQAITDGWLIINSDGNVMIKFKVNSNASISKSDMEIYIPGVTYDSN